MRLTYTLPRLDIPEWSGCSEPLGIESMIGTLSSIHLHESTCPPSIVPNSFNCTMPTYCVFPAFLVHDYFIHNDLSGYDEGHFAKVALYPERE